MASIDHVIQDGVRYEVVDANIVSTLAGTYSPNSTYGVGAYQWHEGTLYRAKVDIQTPEAWTPAHWQQVVTMDEIMNLRTEMEQGDTELKSQIHDAVVQSWTSFDLSTFPPQPYRISGGVWTSDSRYRCVIIPIDKAKQRIQVRHISYTPTYAFLRSDTIIAGSAPDYCVGTQTINIGISREVNDIPADCNYLYVYIGDGSIISKFEVSYIDRINIYTEVKELENANVKTDSINRIDLALYPVIPYNFSSTSYWAYNTMYKSVLIPREDVGVKLSVYNGTYNTSFAFLKSNIVASNETPDLCTNTSIIRQNAGNTEDYYVPNDCRYIAVYIGNDDRINSTAIDSLPSISDLYNVKLDKFAGTENAGKYLKVDNYGTIGYDVINSIGENDTIIDLQSYNPVPYNLEASKTWSSSSQYKGVLIPSVELSYDLLFVSDTYKMRFAFLRSNNIVAGTLPDYCLGTKLITINPSGSKYYKKPEDCKWLYVYISDGTYFGQMGVICKRKDFTLIPTIHNSEKPVYVSNVMQSLLTAKHSNTGVVRNFIGTNVTDNLLLFAHTSDLHNDPTNYGNFIDLLNDYNGVIDFGIVSGDLVDVGYSENFAEMIACESALSVGTAIYKCVGNHECSGLSSEALYNAYQPGSNNGKLYFAKDFSTQKIKIIFLNQYDPDASSTIRGHTGHYTQDQIDWFIGELQSAITNDYSVIVVCHSMGEAGWPLYNNNGFYQQVVGQMYEAYNSGPIISDIINAYKHKGTLDRQYTFTDSEDTLSVQATFADYGKFICYIAGHEHVDVIGYSQVYPDQLICLVQGGVVTSTSRSESSAHWQSKYDTPRVAGTETEMSFNVYAIDPDKKIVKVVKIGSTVTDVFETRSFAVFGY